MCLPLQRGLCPVRVVEVFDGVLSGTLDMVMVASPLSLGS